MRILFIGPLPEPIMGQAVACQVFLDALRQKHDVDVVDLNKSGLSHAAAFGKRLKEVLEIVLQVRRRIKDADCVYFAISQSLAGNLKDLLIYAVCFRKLSRTVIHLQGGTAIRDLLSWRRPLLRTLNAFVLRRIGIVVVLSQRFVGIFEEFVPREKVRIVPNFAVDSVFVDSAEIQKNFSNTSPLRLLFLSNLIPGKGYIELVQAYLSLSPELQKSVSIDFGGEFESDADRANFLRSIEGQPALTYHGVVRGKAKDELLRSAHLFCLPTYYRWEGLPISLLEAYASGCVVLTTNHSAIFDVFSSDRNGFVVEIRSPSSIRAAIERAVVARDSLLQLALNNRADAESYRTAKFNERLMAIVEEQRPT